MKKVILSFLVSALAFILLLIGFYTWTFFQAKKTQDCDSFVIDSYEVHSGINILEIETINCYYDSENEIRTAIYFLKKPLNTENFSKADTSFTLLRNSLLTVEEKPTEELLIAQGNRWGRNWTYVLEPKSSRLWVEIEF
tara:strand:- start:226 stop:642 length:417 start_codon:yes stop_codon:yes gene_type:complete